MVFLVLAVITFRYQGKCPFNSTLVSNALIQPLMDHLIDWCCVLPFILLVPPEAQRTQLNGPFPKGRLETAVAVIITIQV